MTRAWMMGGAAAVLATGLWVIDMPQTVRAKVAILKALPMAPAALNRRIQEVCAGSHHGQAVSTCYLNFYSREASALLEKEERCRDFARAVRTDKDWVGGKDEKDSFFYVGNDAKILDRFGGSPMFYPQECKFYVMSKGDIAAFSF